VTKLKADEMRNFGSIPKREKKPVTSPRTLTLALGPIITSYTAGKTDSFLWGKVATA